MRATGGMPNNRGVRLQGPGRWEIAALTAPRPGQGEVLLAVEVCGVCGSDVHLVDGVTAARYPVVIGHEAAGVIVAAGPGADESLVGTRAAVVPYVGCGKCGLCVEGEAQACPRRRVLGVDLDGAQAGLLAVPSECAVALPGGVPSEIGAILTDAVATPYHAIVRSGVARGQTVVVLGLGGLGLHAVQLLVGVLGCQVIGVDPRRRAREKAVELGAALTLEPGDGVPRTVRGETGDGADAAFEFVGSPGIVDAALRCLRPQGTCVVVGIAPDRLTLGLRQETLVGRELRLRGSFGATASEVAALADLVATGRLDLASSVSRGYRIDDFGAALAETRDKRAGSVRVVVDYR
ncbi:propanol-preferring alcohol dehydrogenase [Prauserella muralis]|nr:propanol-preferring alcohol dehydrogenase [Prauserella muralis]